MQKQKGHTHIRAVAALVSLAAASITPSSASASPRWTTATTNVSVTEGNPAGKFDPNGTPDIFVKVNPAPEPGTLALFALGAAGLCLLRIRHRRDGAIGA